MPSRASDSSYSGIYPCTSAAAAADFHVARYFDVTAKYPGKTAIVTEYGWPAGPDGYAETNERTGHRCGVASPANQHIVVEGTAAQFSQLGIPSVAFSAFSEAWKLRYENPVGPYWGFLVNPIELVPFPPTSLQAAVDGRTVTLTWAAPAGGPALTTYVLEAGSSPGLSDLAAIAVGSLPTLTVANVSAGRYFVRVRAANTSGAGGPSNEVLVVVDGVGCGAAPTSPSNLRVNSIGGGAVTLSWTAAAGAPTTYIIEAGSSAGASDLANSDLGSVATSFTAVGVGRGTYYVRMRGQNACGRGLPSNEIAVVVP
jgi:hypothetical protein